MCIRPHLTQLSFTSEAKTASLAASSVKLRCFKKMFGKITSCMAEREMEERAMKNYFF
jgi:hypothetical protein